MTDALDVVLSAAGATWAIPLAAVVAFHFLAEPARWRLYLCESAAAGFLRLVHIFSLTAFIGYTMPLKMGLPVRIWLLRTRAGMPLTQVTSVLLLDGLLFYAAWGVSAGATLLLFASHLQLGAGMLRAVVGAAAGLLAGVALWLAWSRRARSAPRDGRIGRWIARLDFFHQAARETPPAALLAAVVMVGLDIASHVLRHWLLLAMCAVSLEPGAVALVACVSIFVGLVSLMPMGLGGYDVTLVLLLSQLGVPAEVGVMVALLNRLATIAVGSALGIWGGLALGLNPLRREWVRRTRDG